MELPTFEENDPLGWIARVGKKIEVRNVSQKEKLSFAWKEMPTIFKFWHQMSKNPSWEDLTAAKA